MASILLEERTHRLRYGKRKRRKRAARRGYSRRPPAGSSETTSTAGIATLMAEAGLARRHRTAGRAAVRET
jgi:hypothetical protein